MNLDGSGFNVLQDFPNGLWDGQIPVGDLALSADASMLYGMTSNGGTANRGVVFSESIVPEPASISLLGFATLPLLAIRLRRIEYRAGFCDNL